MTKSSSIVQFAETLHLPRCEVRCRKKQSRPWAALFAALGLPTLKWVDFDPVWCRLEPWAFLAAARAVPAWLGETQVPAATQS